MSSVLSERKHRINNYTLDNHSVYFALFFTQLTAIVAQGSLRSNLLELIVQIGIWGILLGFSLSFGWQYRNKTKSKLPEQLTNIAAIIGLGAFLFQIANGDLTAGLLLMLSWLLIGLSFSLGKQRSLYFSLTASTVLLLYAASISRSSSFILYIIIFTLAAVIALAGNFYLTKKKQQITPQRPNNKLKTDFPYKFPIIILTAIILLITTGLYLLVPRPAAIHWGSFPAGGGRYQAKDDWPKEQEKNVKNKNSANNDTNHSDKSQAEQQEQNNGDAFQYNGFDSDLALNEESGKGSGQGAGGESGKNNYNRLIFYMEGKEPQYLRGKVFDYFDGLSWKTTHQTQTRQDQKTGKFKINPELKSPYDQYTITMEADIAGNNSIFLPPGTAELKFPANAVAIDNYGAVSSPRPMAKGTFYSFNVESNGLRINGRPVDPIQTMGTPDAEALSRYKQLPDDLDSRFTNLSYQITKNSSDVLEKAGKVEKFLRTNYQYSLESVFSSQGKIPLQEFLFETKLGHCEYFATAMVTLMRAQDIPARLVTGFSVSEYNPVTGYYEARGLNAHAWAEVWIDNIGWVTFEATPAYALPTPSRAQNTSQSIEEYLAERAKNSQLSDPGSLTTALLNTTKRVFEQFNLILKKAWSTFKSGLIWSGHMLLSYGWILLLLIATLYTSYHYLRYFITHYRAKKSIARASKKPPSEQIEISYRIMQQIFTLHQHPRPEGWTIQQYQHEMEKHYPGLSNEITDISNSLNTRLYNETSHSENTQSPMLKQAIRIINYKFKIPIPAEKQINKIRDFFQEMSLEKPKKKNSFHNS